MMGFQRTPTSLTSIGLILCLMLFTLTGCPNHKSPFIHKLNASLNPNVTQITLHELTDFDWGYVSGFGPYSSAPIINKCLNKPWEGAKNLSEWLSVNDNTWAFVFTNQDGHVVQSFRYKNKDAVAYFDMFCNISKARSVFKVTPKETQMGNGKIAMRYKIAPY